MKVKKPDADYFWLMIPGLLGSGDLDKAIAYERQLVSMREHIKFDFLLWPDMLTASIESYPIPEHSTLNYINRLLESKNNDEKISRLILFLISQNRIENENLSKLFDRPQVQRHQFPLSVAVDLLGKGLVVDGIGLLRNSFSASASGEIFRRFLILYGALREAKHQTRAEIVSQWCTENIDDTLTIARTVSAEEEILSVTHTLLGLASIFNDELFQSEVNRIDETLDLLVSRSSERPEFYKACLKVVRTQRGFEYRLPRIED